MRDILLGWFALTFLVVFAVGVDQIDKSITKAAHTLCECRGATK